MPQIFIDEPWLLVPLVAIGGGFLCAICGMITCTIRKVSRAKHFEQSRREIAAYVAEGSISPDEGERLLSASA